MSESPVCKHGSLKRQCGYCEFEDQIILHKEKILDLCAQRSKLESENAALIAVNDRMQKALGQCTDEETVLMDKIKRRDELLREYGGHLPLCDDARRDHIDTWQFECVCGWADVQAEILPKDEGKSG